MWGVRLLATGCAPLPHHPVRGSGRCPPSAASGEGIAFSPAGEVLYPLPVVCVCVCKHAGVSPACACCSPHGRDLCRLSLDGRCSRLPRSI